MRVFKLARRSVGLQSIVYTVKTSYKDLGLLFSLVFMGMLVFGSLLYYAENGEPDTGFYSIPQVSESKITDAKESCFASEFYSFTVSIYFFLAIIFRVCGGVYKPSPPLVTETSQWRQ